jgi:diaminopimelate decarboxylase
VVEKDAALFPAWPGDFTRLEALMKTGFVYDGDQLCVDGFPLEKLAAEHGTPLYVYSGNVLRDNYRRIRNAFSGVETTVAYSVKSNSNLAVLKVLKDEGAAFDIVSGGELARVRKLGVPGNRVIFAGVGKTAAEMRDALKAGVAEFNLESEMEAERLNAVAGEAGKTVAVAIRINPDIDAKTHKYITTGKTENKFGVSMQRAMVLAGRMGKELKNLRLEGLHCHVGSQILDPSVHPQVVQIVTEFTRALMAGTGAKLKTINFGGGFGIAYKKDQKPLDLKPFAKAVTQAARELDVKLLLEPGRSIAGPAGILVARVEYVKPGDAKTFVILDASMTELMRPTLYQAYHEVLPVQKRRGRKVKADFVGPVCETGDFLALDRETVVPQQGDLVAIKDTGAYGFVMASHYNTRPNAAELLIDGGKVHVARKREKYADLMRGEAIPE